MLVLVSLLIAVAGLFIVDLRAENIVLKDGRLFKDAEVFSQSALSVMIKHQGVVSSVPKKLLPDDLLAQYPLDAKAAAEAKMLDEKAVAEAKAKELLNTKIREAAENGDPSAQFVVGNMFVLGDGVSRDIVEASKWYHKSAEQGDVRAQFSLARMYDSGEGISRDFREAAKWYRKAAEQGNSEAQSGLGILYQRGFGVRKDSAEAAKWIRMAADQGNVTCQKMMVSFYKTGEGVPRDAIEALAWVYVAAASGDDEARRLRNQIDFTPMSNPNLILAAQQRSTEIFRTIAANKSRIPNLIQKSSIAPPEAASAKGNGSGVIVSSSGYVLTAAHVVKGSSKVTVVTTQGSRSAKVVQIDEANDVAILKLENGTYPALPVISSRQIRLGQAISTIGFPVVNVQGFSPKVTRGEISSMNGAGDDPRKWQISAPVQPGNSGGPLLDENGNVVGIVVSRLFGDTVQNVNYATKSVYALGLLEPYLGESPPVPNAATPPPRFEDMIAKAEQSVVLILIY